jgi:hypothetical protein
MNRKKTIAIECRPAPPCGAVLSSASLESMRGLPMLDMLSAEYLRKHGTSWHPMAPHGIGPSHSAWFTQDVGFAAWPKREYINLIQPLFVW